MPWTDIFVVMTSYSCAAGLKVFGQNLRLTVFQVTNRVPAFGCVQCAANLILNCHLGQMRLKISHAALDHKRRIVRIPSWCQTLAGNTLNQDFVHKARMDADTSESQDVHFDSIEATQLYREVPLDRVQTAPLRATTTMVAGAARWSIHTLALRTGSIGQVIITVVVVMSQRQPPSSSESSKLLSHNAVVTVMSHHGHHRHIHFFLLSMHWIKLRRWQAFFSPLQFSNYRVPRFVRLYIHTAGVTEKYKSSNFALSTRETPKAKLMSYPYIDQGVIDSSGRSNYLLQHRHWSLTAQVHKQCHNCLYNLYCIRTLRTNYTTIDTLRYHHLAHPHTAHRTQHTTRRIPILICYSTVISHQCHTNTTLS